MTSFAISNLYLGPKLTQKLTIKFGCQTEFSGVKVPQWVYLVVFAKISKFSWAKPTLWRKNFFWCFYCPWVITYIPPGLPLGQPPATSLATLLGYLLGLTLPATPMPGLPSRASPSDWHPPVWSLVLNEDWCMDTIFSTKTVTRTASSFGHLLLLKKGYMYLIKRTQHHYTFFVLNCSNM